MTPNFQGFSRVYFEFLKNLNNLQLSYSFFQMLKENYIYEKENVHLYG